APSVKKAMPIQRIGAIFPLPTTPMSLHDMEKGVRYVCQRCGNCCRWPGEVPLSDAEVMRISRYLGMEEDDFVERYTVLRRNRAGLALVSRPNHECVFLDGI